MGFKFPRNILMVLSIIILFSIVSLIAANSVFFFSNEIYRGVTVANIPVGDLSVTEAVEKITKVLRERTKQPVLIINYGKDSWNVTAEEIDFAVDANALAANAYNIGRQGNIFHKLRERYIAINNGYDLPLAIQYDQMKLYNIIAKIAKTIDCQPQNASIKVLGSGVTIDQEVLGREVDIAKVMADSTAQLATAMNITIPLTVTEVMPTVVASDFQDIDGILASYTTQFNAADYNRSQNIYLAAKNINGTLIRAGSIFSFNKFVGPRLAQNGYKEAPVFIDGELVPDWGGGVCQVSTTLYNAVLLADMGIEERTPHFSPPGYVPLGQDATVADNLLDFKFKNTSATNIYITSEVYGNQITISILGKRSNMPDIRIISEQKTLEPGNIVKQDPNLELGNEVVESPGQKGFIVTTYRIKYANGSEINREWLGTDEFKPIDRVIKIGTKVAAKQPIK